MASATHQILLAPASQQREVFRRTGQKADDNKNSQKTCDSVILKRLQTPHYIYLPHTSQQYLLNKDLCFLTNVFF